MFFVIQACFLFSFVLVVLFFPALSFLLNKN